MRLLSVDADPETTRGRCRNVLTGILYLAPAEEAGIGNVCPKASPGCRAACLYTAGRAGFTPSIVEARIRKTRELFADREKFFDTLSRDIRNLRIKAVRQGLLPAVRLNGTFDLPWLAHEMAERHPETQLYDYTKIPRPWERVRENYDLTFSLSELNREDAKMALNHGIRVAVVFDTKKGQPLPKRWEGIPVIDGNLYDARFLDPKDVVVGLRAKGKAIRSVSGFVQAAEAQ